MLQTPAIAFAHSLESRLSDSLMRHTHIWPALPKGRGSLNANFRNGTLGRLGHTYQERTGARSRTAVGVGHFALDESPPGLALEAGIRQVGIDRLARLLLGEGHPAGPGAAEPLMGGPSADARQGERVLPRRVPPARRVQAQADDWPIMDRRFHHHGRVDRDEDV